MRVSSSVVHAVMGPDEGNRRGLAGTSWWHVDCMQSGPEVAGRLTRFGCVATLFTMERVTGIEPALSAWERLLCLRERTDDRVRSIPI